MDPGRGGGMTRVRLLLLLLLGLGCSNGGRCSSAQTLLPPQEGEAQDTLLSFFHPLSLFLQLPSSALALGFPTD
jgi:hypothetical protein